MATSNSRGGSKTSSKKAAPKLSAAEREQHEREKHAPVSLESGGSYEASKLFSGLDKAVDKQGGNRDAEVRKALDNARSDAPRTDTAAPNALPGHRTAKVEVQLAPGTEVGKGKDKKIVGGVTVTELRQVYDPGEDSAGDAGTVAPGNDGQAVVGTGSEILSVEMTDEPPAPAPGPDAGGETDAGETGTTTTLDAGDTGGGSSDL